MHRSGFVSMVGRPNVGKSSVINGILGESVLIVSDKPQTTRNQLKGIYSTDDAQIVFLDTPGIHKPKHSLGEMLNTISEKALEGIDVAVMIVDMTEQFGKGDQLIYQQYLLHSNAPKKVLLLNKCDKCSETRRTSFRNHVLEFTDFDKIFDYSAVSGEGKEEFLEWIMTCLPEGPKFYPEDILTDDPMRFIAAEKIREAILHQTDDEIPHSVTVLVENMIERKGKQPDFIQAFIYYEHSSQKKILLGNNGSKIKSIGMEARNGIEAIWGKQVFLDIRLKERKNWRKSPEKIRQLMGKNFARFK